MEIVKRSSNHIVCRRRKKT